MLCPTSWLPCIIIVMAYAIIEQGALAQIHSIGIRVTEIRIIIMSMALLATNVINAAASTNPAAIAIAIAHTRTFPRLLSNNFFTLRDNTGTTTTTYSGSGSWSSVGPRVSARSMAPGRVELEQRVNNNNTNKKKDPHDDGVLQKGIAEFYDESSGIWEDIWGDHMHHGFYDPASTVSVSDHRPAQIRMIEEALRFASLPEDPTKWPNSVVDVGCGIGGSSRYLSKKFGATAIGITLSPVQAQRANALAAAQGLADKVSFQVADALEQPFPDGQFDLVWSMESGEHMPDKEKFVGELARVAAPGATIIIVTWCHRDLGPTEESLKPWEENHLKKICDAFYLPAWCSTADYVKLLESHSLQDIKSADWSPYVAPFWPAVIRSALTWKGLTSILRSGLKTIKGALAMPLMIEGFKKDLIKFAIITCRKPE